MQLNIENSTRLYAGTVDAHFNRTSNNQYNYALFPVNTLPAPSKSYIYTERGYLIIVRHNSLQHA